MKFLFRFLVHEIWSIFSSRDMVDVVLNIRSALVWTEAAACTYRRATPANRLFREQRVLCVHMLSIERTYKHSELFEWPVVRGGRSQSNYNPKLVWSKTIQKRFATFQIFNLFLKHFSNLNLFFKHFSNIQLFCTKNKKQISTSF